MEDTNWKDRKTGRRGGERQIEDLRGNNAQIGDLVQLEMLSMLKKMRKRRSGSDSEGSGSSSEGNGKKSDFDHILALRRRFQKHPH